MFEEYYPSLCYYAIRFIEDPQQVKDIVQNFFVKIWEKKGLRFDNPTALNSYLYTSIRNACLNHIRQEKLHDNIHQQIPTEQVSENEYLQEQLENEVMQEIFGAIEDLPKKSKRVFRYSYLYGMSNNEIAEALGISINTVKTHKLKAKQQLKERLKNVFNIVVLLKMGF